MNLLKSLSLNIQQCEGKPYNVKSDMWALGCILHEMATLQRTFDASNINAVVNKIVQVSCVYCTPNKSSYLLG